MTRLSVNINKIATIRNSRGGNIPNVLQAAIDCQKFGGEGITVHPRPDERHIRKQDVYDIKPAITTEFNIEGYPSKEFVDLVLDILPDQVTLVPDPPETLTSNQGWDTIKNKDFLKEIVSEFHMNNIRTSIFIGTDVEFIDAAAETGTNRIELYTEPYATIYREDKEKAVEPFVIAAQAAIRNDLGINAGHDLNLNNLNFFYSKVPGLLEVSIGHALIADALYMGLEKTIALYLKALK
jgi:pyridoxine 5-phosphate synthase